MTSIAFVQVTGKADVTVTMQQASRWDSGDHRCYEYSIKKAHPHNTAILEAGRIKNLYAQPIWDLREAPQEAQCQVGTESYMFSQYEFSHQVFNLILEDLGSGSPRRRRVDRVHFLLQMKTMALLLEGLMARPLASAY